MTEILDNFEEKKKKNYAKRSFRQFIIAVSSLSVATGIFWFIIIPKLDTKFMKPNSIFVLAGLSFLIFTIRGFINGIRSYRQKEPSSKIKQAAMIGNAILLCLLIGYSIYSYESFVKVFIPRKVERLDSLN